MRRICFLIPLAIAATALSMSGCRQTTATTSSGALIPLSPNNPAAPPNLLPFGTGQTRVTPPPAGTVGAPNNYLGGVPNAQINNPAAGGFALQAAPNPVGSGVRQTGWISTNEAGVAAAPVVGVNQQGVLPATVDTTLGAAPLNPRSGGMQVIDLTNAPPPPGYRPNFNPQGNFGTQSISQPNMTAPGFNGQQNFNSQPAFRPAPAPVQSIQVPAAGTLANVQPNRAATVAQAPAVQTQPGFQSQPGVQSQPGFQSQPGVQSQPGFQSQPASGFQSQPAAGNTLTPVGSPQPISQQPATQPAFNSQPSTAPTNGLRWRTPGTQF